MFCFTSCTGFHGRHVDAGRHQHGRSKLSLAIFSNVLLFNNFVLENTMQPEIVLILSLYYIFK